MDIDHAKITGAQVLHLRTALKSIDLHASSLHDMLTSRAAPGNLPYMANIAALIEDLAILGLSVIEHTEQCSDTEYTLNAPAR